MGLQFDDYKPSMGALHMHCVFAKGGSVTENAELSHLGLC